MRNFLILFFSLFFCSLHYSQNSKASFLLDEPHQQMGKMENVFQINSDFILQNPSNSKIYILRADVSNLLKVRVHKRTLMPGDTARLFVQFNPTKSGKFKESIKVVISSEATPLELSISGEVVTLKADDKQACYSFNKHQKIAVPTGNYLALVPKKTSQDSNVVVTQDSLPDAPIQEPLLASPYILDPIVYKPNNIVFLVDVSGSMNEENKLPLMKQVLGSLLNSLRATDKISFVTYSDSAKLLVNGASGDQNVVLQNVINNLKTKGYTKGAKAILYSQDIAINNYITEGINQVYLITDGKFPFYSGHYKQWEAKQENKQVILSTIGLGNDKESLKSLSDIAKMGKGTFVRVKSKNSVDDLIEDIKVKSKR